MHCRAMLFPIHLRKTDLTESNMNILERNIHLQGLALCTGDVSQWFKLSNSVSLGAYTY